MRAGKAVRLAVEVKDKAVEAATAIHLADETARRGADKALLVAIAQDQEPLSRDAIRRDCLHELRRSPRRR